MHIDPKSKHTIPLETSQSARSLYNLQHIYLRIGDELDNIFSGIDVALFDPTSRLDTLSLSRLALATSFQLAEDISDNQAAEATFQRLDWKFALFLPVKHPGLSERELCGFRQGLLSTSQGLREFGLLLIELKKLGLFPLSTHFLAEPQTELNHICQVTLLYALKVQIKEALGMLVSLAPDWLVQHVSPHWYERYSTQRFNPGSAPVNGNLTHEANRLGMDVWHLLDVLVREDTGDLAHKPEIQSLIRLFQNQFALDGDSVQWQAINCVDCSFYQPGKGGL